MTIERTNAGINKAKDAGKMDAQNHVRQGVAAGPSDDGGQLRISWLDRSGYLVPPNVGNISE